MIRKATLRDITEIVVFLKSVQPYSAYDGIKVYDDHLKKNLTHLLSTPMGLLLVVEKDGKICGALGAVANSLWFSRRRYATDLFCVVNADGKGYGVGLVRRFLLWARAIPGVKEIYTSVSSEMDDAGRTDRLYKKIGWRRVGGLYRAEK